MGAKGQIRVSLFVSVRWCSRRASLACLVSVVYRRLLLLVIGVAVRVAVQQDNGGWCRTDGT